MQKEGKGLTAGQLTMMALGCVIGGSFFLGTAVAINEAGPSVIISYIVWNRGSFYPLRNIRNDNK